jgi:hypothetical protein
MVQRPKKIDASKYHAYALCCALQAEIALPNHDIQKVVAVKNTDGLLYRQRRLFISPVTEPAQKDRKFNVTCGSLIPCGATAESF